MVGKMTDIHVKETSGVDHPAHLHEGFLVMKAADRPRAEAAVAAFGKKADMTTPPASKAVPMTPEDITKAIDKALQPILDNLAKGWSDLRAYAEKNDSSVPSTEGTDPNAAGADPAVAAQAQTDMALSADMLKSAPEAVAKAFDAQRDELRKAREEIAKERTIRLDNEAIAFAKANYPNLNLPDETVKSIRLATETDPTVGEALKALLVSHNAMLDGVDVLKELGSSSTSTETAPGTALATVEEKAKALMESDPAKFDTIQKAKAHVYETDADLAARAREEV
jgi:hypothetical protein